MDSLLYRFTISNWIIGDSLFSYS